MIAFRSFNIVSRHRLLHCLKQFARQGHTLLLDTAAVREIEFDLGKVTYMPALLLGIKQCQAISGRLEVGGVEVQLDTNFLIGLQADFFIFG